MIVETFTSQTSSGTRIPAFSRFAGIYGAAFISNAVVSGLQGDHWLGSAARINRVGFKPGIPSLRGICAAQVFQGSPRAGLAAMEVE